MRNWNLPPGCTDEDIDRHMGAYEPQCEGCGKYTDEGELHDLELMFDTASNITSVTIDTVDQLLTGTLRFSDPSPLEDFARFYDFELVDGSGATANTGSFYIEDRFLYGLFIYANGDFAVLQRSFMGRPAGGFANDDLAFKMTSTRVLGVFVRWAAISVIDGDDGVGDWEIRTDNVSPATDPIPYNGMIGGDVVDLPRPPYQQGEKTLENGIPISGNLTNFDPMGAWEGIDASARPMIAIMSFDKEFAGMYDCDPNGFSTCTFFIWSPIVNR